MKKSFLLTTAAALSLVMSGMAQAADTQTNVKVRGDTGNYVAYSSDEEEVTQKEVENALDKAGHKIENLAGQAVDAVDGNNEAAVKADVGVVAKNNSADQLIGQPVKNASGERIGTVHDVILAQNGQAKYLIVADGGMVSLGDKKVAFDYGAIEGRDAAGAVLTAATEETINAAPAFSYDAEDSKEGAQVIAASETSLRAVLDAKLTDPQDKTVANVEDVVIENGRAEDLIVSYDQFLGLGGKKASLPYEDLAFSNDGVMGTGKFRLNASQATQFKTSTRTMN